MAISPKLLNEGESVVVSTRTHWKSLVLPVLVLVIAVGVGAFLTGPVGKKAFIYALWIVVGLVVVWFSVLPFLRWLTSTYTVTSRRLITRHGILTRTGHDIPLNRISDVSSERGVVDRLVGCGTLIISDASTHGRVSLPDVPHVERLQLQLSDLLYGGGGGGAGDGGAPEGRHDEGV